jgi:hypothetical protein
LEQQNSLLHLMLLLSSSPLLRSQTMHPTPKCCTLMFGLGFRLFEGDGRMVAFPTYSRHQTQPLEDEGTSKINRKRKITVSKGIIQNYDAT